MKTDKDSGIVNDANDWANETMHNPRYRLELLLRNHAQPAPPAGAAAAGDYGKCGDDEDYECAAGPEILGVGMKPDEKLEIKSVSVKQRSSNKSGTSADISTTGVKADQQQPQH